MNPILVTGATGTVGSHLVHILRRRETPVRAYVRERAKGRRILGPDVELAVGEFADPHALASAMDGVEQVFLACANHPQQAEWETAVIDAAARAGVRRVVKLSARDARTGSPVAFADAHGRIAEHLQNSGVAAVLLKPGFMMSNLFGGAHGVQHAGALFLPAAGASIAMVDPRDVAEVAATVCTTDGHDGHSYELTGPEPVTFDRVAEILSALLARPIGNVAVPEDAAVAALIDSGVSEWFATNLVAQFGLLRQGTQAEATGLVRALTGREPRTIDEFLHDHAAAFGVTTAAPA